MGYLCLRAKRNSKISVMWFERAEANYEKRRTDSPVWLRAALLPPTTVTWLTLERRRLRGWRSKRAGSLEYYHPRMRR